FGFVGQVLLIGLFALFSYRCFTLARLNLQSGKPFAAYLAYGVGLLITLQAIINIGVNMGALPTKGLTLPFISYGGNSILSMSFAVGLVLRVYYEYQSDPSMNGRRAGKR
ncbi:MAG: FtsW/RodA/SpoVE family cell cycle protein, partial [Pseudomonadota bacterium]